MVRHVSSREARTNFAELTDRVRYAGERVIVEKQGQPFVAVVSLEDLELLERVRRDDDRRGFTRLAAAAARESGGDEPSEDEIIGQVRKTRESLYSERYGSA